VKALRIAFDAQIPNARWGPLFHVFRLERPSVRLDWQAVGFPVAGRSLLEGADVGLFLQPPSEPGLRALTLDTSPMVVVMAVGHRLAQRDVLTLSDVLDEPFPSGARLHPEWTAFWTLDRQRGEPAKRTDDDVVDAGAGLDVVAAGRAISTAPTWVASGLAHPGVVALPLSDGPPVATSLVWRADEEDPAVLGLVDLATAWVAGASTDGAHGNRRVRHRPGDPPSRRRPG
jgi:DNA-binding transcriptional LysR family regulator